MSVSKKDFGKFSKNEIIDALFQRFSWNENDNTLSGVLLQAKQNKFNNLITKSDTAYQNYKKASEADLQYRAELFTKYGKDKLSLFDLTNNEASHLVSLNNEKNILWKKYMNFNKTSDKICK